MSEGIFNLKIVPDFTFLSRCKNHRSTVGQRKRPHLWILYIVLLSSFIDQFRSVVYCEFNFGYETEDYMSAVINLTYVDPVSGLLVQENLEMGKLLPGKTEEVTGVVVHVTSNNHTNHMACEKLDANIVPKEPFIALIKHGSCRDQVKLRNVADENASAAVLYSDNHSTRFIKVERKANRITFVVISEKKGEQIAALVDNGTRVMMRIGIGSRGVFRFGTINKTSVLFVSISFILLMVISFAWLVFYYVQRFRYIHAKEILSRQLCSAAKKALDRIPVKTVKSDDSENEDDFECCAICIEHFQHGELIRSLPCNHCFHKICIDPWLLEQRSCPMCKLDILLHFGLVYTGSQESVLEIDDDDFFRPRHSLAEHDIVLVQNQRRHSSVRVAISRREDRATSPCSLSSLNPDAVVEQSFVCTTVDMSDVAVNTSDPPSEADYESSEDRWTSPFPKKFQPLTNRGSVEALALQCTSTVMTTEEENYEICDLTFED
ncbi:RING finger protein 150-like isoform X1 [Argiope bruennichi]|uniref:Protein goliath like protein n=1 Tax=Argiope bruennichi TaxID=94029 RepID=A0A8T0F2W3_ARGBR|nr:RING finger protein 150-like isoform X1 [Argiope bruennichi]KAF8784618.1 Protein goliath like protein [Argiope bruennichi]